MTHVSARDRLSGWRGAHHRGGEERSPQIVPATVALVVQARARLEQDRGIFPVDGGEAPAHDDAVASW
jgi:hypothetical protein